MTTVRIKSRQFSATSAALNLPHLHLVPPLGVTLFEFCRYFQHQKTTVTGLSCEIVCVILHLAISVERQTDRHTMKANTCAS